MVANEDNMRVAIFTEEGSFVEIFDSMREAQAALGQAQDSGEWLDYFCAHYGVRRD